MEVTTTNILAHFQSNCSGLHEVDAITIQGKMMDYFVQAEVIPQYINTMESAQAHTKRAKLPISDEALFAILNRAMLRTEKYAGKRRRGISAVLTSACGIIGSPYTGRPKLQTRKYTSFVERKD